MKKLALILCLLTFSSIIRAQYFFSTGSSPYVPLTSPISANGSTIWNEGDTFPIFFSFNFTINGQTFNALSVRAGGGLNFPATGTRELFMYHTPFGGYMLHDRGTTTTQSPISYEESGWPGTRILKIQWSNAGFVQWYTSSDPNDYVNFQIWLFEWDNHIEIHFGPRLTDPGTYGYPEATSDSSPGPSPKLFYDLCSDVFCITGPASLPSSAIYNLCSPTYTFVDGTPNDGIVYFFYLAGFGINEIPDEYINQYPNPFTNEISVITSSADIHIRALQIIEPTGRIVLQTEYKTEQDKITVPTDLLPSGIYFLKLSDFDNRQIIKKIVKN